MTGIPPEVVTANRLSALFWAVALAVIFLLGYGWSPVRRFRAAMLSQWKPALAIALVYVLARGLGGYGFLSLSSAGIFAEALIGLTIARSIRGHDPLPVSTRLAHRGQPAQAIGTLLICSAVLGMVVILINGLGMPVLWRIIGEPMPTGSGTDLFPTDWWKAFFLLLAGAGIAEETLYRLLFLPLFWRLTGKPWLGVILSAVLFGAYHLSPLDALYRSYWQAPVSSLVGTTLVGVLWGYVYLKRGYETAVLGHVLGDWASWVLSAA